MMIPLHQFIIGGSIVALAAGWAAVTLPRNSKASLGCAVVASVVGALVLTAIDTLITK